MIFPFTVTRLVYCNVYDVFPNNVYTVTNTAPFARLILTVKGKKKGKGSFYIAQYPVRWTAQSTLHFLT